MERGGGTLCALKGRDWKGPDRPGAGAAGLGTLGLQVAPSPLLGHGHRGVILLNASKDGCVLLQVTNRVRAWQVTCNLHCERAFSPSRPWESGSVHEGLRRPL